jgi:hypothetical protein
MRGIYFSPVTVEARILSHASLCEMRCGQSHTGTRYFSDTLDFPCQYHSAKLHTHRHLNSTPIRRTSGRPVGTFKQRMLFLISGSSGRTSPVTLLCSLQRPSRWTVPCCRYVIVLFRLLSYVLLPSILFHNCHGHRLIFFPLECVTRFMLVEWS